MKGDFSRTTFDSSRRFSRVLLQQGRVQLDADFNEHADIQLHYLRTLAQDVIGPHGGPGDGFKIGIRTEADVPVSNDLLIGSGHYYVQGILCENEAGQHYTEQTDYPLGDDEVLQNGKNYVVYLDVWERHLTHLEVEGIREVALGGPDTATRARIVWQVKAMPTGAFSPRGEGDERHPYDDYDHFLERLKNSADGVKPGNGQLRAKARADADNHFEPCTICPEARYRGIENQLYRVEIHEAGEGGSATFKWSRDNGAVVFPIRSLTTQGEEATVIQVEHLGRDGRFRLAEGDWVEIVDDEYVLRGRTDKLLRVKEVRPDEMQVILEGVTDSNVGADLDKHPLVRRWDHKGTSTVDIHDDGAILVKERVPVPRASEVTPEENWLELEDGIYIQFQPEGTYQTGDYWLVPARTETRNIEWPEAEGEGPAPRPPRGVEHFYAPLAHIKVSEAGSEAGKVTVVSSLRRKIEPIASGT
ncbi:MAG: DUF6519 domain-containing protein [Planctomycetota bacterium]|jgi:hypothetical protein